MILMVAVLCLIPPQGYAADQPVAEVPGFTYQPPQRAAKPPVSAPTLKYTMGDLLVPQVALGPVDRAALYEEDRIRAMQGRVLRYGVGRDIRVELADGQWHKLPGGDWLWVVDVVAQGALGVRVHFAELDVPPKAHLYVYATDAPEKVKGPYDRRDMSDSRELWAPTAFGERIRIEYLLPAEAMVDRIGHRPFIIDRIQHIYLEPMVKLWAEGNGSGDGRDDLSCHNDVTCYPDWANVAAASAGIGYIGSDALFCCGTLLNCVAADGTPYFLTANHCIDSDADAESCEVYWFYETTSCNGSPPWLSSVPQTAVAQRLAYGSTYSSSDYCLLLLEGSLPGGVVFAGWTSAAVSNGTNCTSVHHPSGTFKRISFGTKISSSAYLITVDWYDGPTWYGSSGGGLFLDSTQQLVGQLLGGNSECPGLGQDEYGAFSVTYPNIAGYLGSGGADDDLEPNDTCESPATVGQGSYPSLIVKSSDEDWYEIAVPASGQLAVDLTFTHANGDVDMKLYDVCGGTEVATSTSSTNDESFTYTNSGAASSFYLHVYLYSDTQNTYDMAITVSGGGLEYDECDVCFEAGDGTHNGDTSDNTGSTGDDTSCTPNDTIDEWICYTASCTGTATASLCGSDYDTSLAVFSACVSGELACNDDACATQSEVSWEVTLGNTYYVRVSGYQGATGTYQLVLSCESDGSYCAASGGCDEYITSVQVGSIDNSGTACTGYADYTAQSTIMQIGTEYSITVTNGQPYTSDQCGIWVDWNRDYDFDDAGEAISVSGIPGGGPYTADITPPAGASVGDTRMRIRITYTGDVVSCGTATYGEVEDYTITVQDSPCPGEGDCCVDNGTPGCEDTACCETVCAADPYCCTGVWDMSCAIEAGSMCGDLCGECQNDPDCDDGVFCNGAEACVSNSCQDGDAPCAGQWCDETDDICVSYGNGDFDADGDVDLNDFAAFQKCFSRSADVPCRPGNMTGSDGMINLDDFDEFSAVLGGP
ncbi:MAG: trypsin-like peptidase domain-containing protein [Phycisphaerae bacterium]|nr:trypsin-like peptidase domain-containing protein [Phycisphaerae bacterium]